MELVRSQRRVLRKHKRQCATDDRCRHGRATHADGQTVKRDADRDLGGQDGGVAVRAVFFFQAEDGIRDYKVTSSDVCSSDLTYRVKLLNGREIDAMPVWQLYMVHFQDYDLDTCHQICRTPKDLLVRWARDSGSIKPAAIQIGRASCRERV